MADNQIGGVLDPTRDLVMSGSIRCLGSLGYSSGAGARVTELVSRGESVTINALSGAITTNTASLTAEASAVMRVFNSFVEIGDVPILAQRSGGNGTDTAVYVSAVANGYFDVTTANNNPAGVSAETGAIIINFAIIKAVSQ